MKYNTLMNGVKCQSTSNFVLIQGEILLYDGNGLVSNLDDINGCMAQKGKCITLALFYGIAPIQPIIVYIEKLGDAMRATNQLILMENSPNETFDPENVKFQYLFDSLRQELLQQLKETYQSSCQNKNNLLLLIKWLSISNPTLAAKLMLQRNDVIAKRIDGNLMVALCKSERLAIENIEFKGEQMEKEYNEIVLPIKEEFEDLFLNGSLNCSNPCSVLLLNEVQIKVLALLSLWKHHTLNL
uniref:Uncharacterized protein n=1 Tax=Wuchereria bancrofti TaxID=6293 RepID=A0A1I8EWS3_WUCBA